MNRDLLEGSLHVHLDYTREQYVKIKAYQWAML